MVHNGTSWLILFVNKWCMMVGNGLMMANNGQSWLIMAKIATTCNRYSDFHGASLSGSSTIERAQRGCSRTELRRLKQWLRFQSFPGLWETHGFPSAQHNGRLTPWDQHQRGRPQVVDLSLSIRAGEGQRPFSRRSSCWYPGMFCLYPSGNQIFILVLKTISYIFW